MQAVLDTTLEVAVKKLSPAVEANEAQLAAFAKEVAFMHACRCGQSACTATCLQTVRSCRSHAVSLQALRPCTSQLKPAEHGKM